MNHRESMRLLGEKIGACIEAACVMEVLAPKAGNVHPGFSWNFTDLEVADFLASARALRPVFETAADRTVGELVLEAVRATRAVVSTNTNLGQILLIAPLSKAAFETGRIDREDVMEILLKSTVHDAIAAYEAIALAKPGGMGQRGSQDIAGRPTCTLYDAMKFAASYDDVAAQYATGFSDVFEMARDLESEFRISDDWRRAIADVHLVRLVRGDTLVRRKCGDAIETELKSLAASVVRHRADPAKYHAEYARIDAWLRADGNRRNPGTTADLITAALFVGLFSGTIEIPPDLMQQASKYSKQT